MGNVHFNAEFGFANCGDNVIAPWGVFLIIIATMTFKQKAMTEQKIN